MRKYVSDIYPVEETANTPLSIEAIASEHFYGEYKKVLWRFDISFIACVISGKGELSTDSGKFMLRPGDFFIICKNNNYTLSKFNDNMKQPFSYIRINIRKDYIINLFYSLNIENVQVMEHSGLETLFRKGISLANDENIETISKQKSLVTLVMEILIEVAYKYNCADTSSTAMNLDKACNDGVYNRKLLFPSSIQKVKDYIDKHLEDKLYLNDLNNIVQLTPRHISKLFKDEFGVTPYNYYLLKRIELSRLLLLHTNLSVKEIANKLKFADEFYFSNIFKLKTGISPIQYKRDFS